MKNKICGDAIDKAIKKNKKKKIKGENQVQASLLLKTTSYERL